MSVLKVNRRSDSYERSFSEYPTVRYNKRNPHEFLLQSAKIMVSVREIFLNDEHDLEYHEDFW